MAKTKTTETESVEQHEDRVVRLMRQQREGGGDAALREVEAVKMEIEPHVRSSQREMEQLKKHFPAARRILEAIDAIDWSLLATLADDHNQLLNLVERIRGPMSLPAQVEKAAADALRVTFHNVNSTFKRRFFIEEILGRMGVKGAAQEFENNLESARGLLGKIADKLEKTAAPVTYARVPPEPRRAQGVDSHFRVLGE